MKKILTVSTLFFAVFVWWLFRPAKPIHFTQPIRQISPEQITPAISHIRSINDLNSRIRSFYSEVDLTVQKQFSHTVKGKLFYEKDRNFRVRCWSTFKKEIDIGSNDQNFWFWSSRMNPPTLYYCPQTHVAKNRLRAPFHPLWIIETLSIGHVDLQNAQIVEQGDNWVVLQTRTSTIGEPVVKITLVSKSMPAIIGHYLFDSQGKMIISTEVESWHHFTDYSVPCRMRTVWYEENVTLFWFFRVANVNLGIDPEEWVMPSAHRHQDISL